MMSRSNIRTQIINEAAVLINGDREHEYGTPADNFQRVADLWYAFDDSKIEPWQVCIKLALLKIGRLGGPKPSRDSFVDAVGYIALAAELSMQSEHDDDN